jgi:uncharacterized protein YciI
MKTAYWCYCIDHERAPELRQQHMGAHLQYIESILDRVLVAGPLRDSTGRVVGSCLVYDAASRAEAGRLLQADPYHRGGVWRQVDIQEFTLAAGAWIGGAAWKQSHEESP